MGRQRRFRERMMLPFLVLLSASPGLAEAQEGDEDYQTVVRASAPDLDERSPRTSKPVELNADAPLTGLGQALESKSTLDAQETNRGAASPILRGFIGPQISLVLDGIPLNLATFRTGPNQYARLVPTMALEALTITEGPASTLYGQGALGGALHFKTRPVDSQTSYRSVFSAESADEGLGGALTLASPLTEDNALQLMVGAGQWRHGILRTGGGFRALGSDYNEDQIAAKLRYEWASRLYSEAFYGMVSINNAGRTDQLGKSDMRRYDTSHHLAYHRLRYEGAQGAAVKRASVTVATQFLDDQVRRGTCADDFRTLSPIDRRSCTNLVTSSLSRLRFYEDTTLALKLLADTVIELTPDLDFVIDASAHRETITSALRDLRGPVFTLNDEGRGQFADGSSLHALSAMALVEHQAQFTGLGRLKTVLGTRLLHQSLFAPALPALGDVDVDAQGWAMTLSTEWRAARGFYGYLAFDRGVRLPNLQESTVLGDTGSKFEIPNPELGAEAGLAYEAGVGHKSEYSGIFGSVAYTQVSDYISEASALYQGESEFEDKPVVQRVNADEGRVLSTLARGWILFGDIKLSGEARWYRANITTDGTTVAGRRIPPLTYLAELSHKTEGHVLSLWVRGAQTQNRLSPIDRKDLRICETGRWSGILEENCIGTPAWQTINLAYVYTLNRSWNLTVQALNILDTFYKSHGSGFDASGRSLLVNLTHRGRLNEW